MQALNLQLLETQNSKTQPKNFSLQKNEPKSGMSFRDMVKSIAKKDVQKKENTARPVSARHAAAETRQADTLRTAEPEKAEATENEEVMPEEKIAESGDKNNKIPKDQQGRIVSEETEADSTLKAENAETKITAAELEAMPADFIVRNDLMPKAEAVAVNTAEVPAEAVAVNDAEYSFLKTKAPSNDDPHAIIENAVEYESADDKLINAQNLLAENPEEFLDGRQIASENAEASEVTLAAFGNLSQQVNGESTQETKGQNAFNLEVADSASEAKPEATNLFKDIFTVTDNRSVEEKISEFKTMVNEKSETSQNNELNLSLSLSENASQNILASNSQSAGATGSTFQEMLTQQVQTNVPDFVKAGNIVLRDNNQGSINMILKPEALGNVKINLQVADNVITGQITVHSKEAFEAFKQNMDSLRQAFQDSGYENAQLNLSFADGSSSGAFAQGEQQQSSQQFFANKTYSSYAASADTDDYGAETETAETFSYGNGTDKTVSIVA